MNPEIWAIVHALWKVRNRATILDGEEESDKSLRSDAAADGTAFGRYVSSFKVVFNMGHNQ